MDTATILQLVKLKIGIKSSTARDSYINAIINGVAKELEEEKGLKLNSGNAYHLLFIVDYIVFRYENPKEGMPRNLQFRLHNLMIHGTGAV